MPLSQAQLNTLASMRISQLERSVLAAGEEPTYIFLRVPMPPGMAVDKPANERFLLLRVPVAIINASARRGRKWVLYVATAVTGTSGHLRQDGRDLQPEAMDEPVADNETYDFVAGGTHKRLSTMLLLTTYSQARSTLRMLSVVPPGRPSILKRAGTTIGTRLPVGMAGDVSF